MSWAGDAHIVCTGEPPARPYEARGRGEQPDRSPLQT